MDTMLRPVVRYHSRTLSSSLAVASTLPSGLNVSAHTRSVSTFMTRSAVPASAFHR